MSLSSVNLNCYPTARFELKQLLATWDFHAQAAVNNVWIWSCRTVVAWGLCLLGCDSCLWGVTGFWRKMLPSSLRVSHLPTVERCVPSVVKEGSVFRTYVTLHPVKQYHIPGDLNPHIIRLFHGVFIHCNNRSIHTSAARRSYNQFHWSKVKKQVTVFSDVKYC